MSAGCLIAFARHVGLSRIYWGALAGAALTVTGACLLFRMAPTPRRAKLRPYAELLMAVATFGLVLALVLR